MCAHPNMKAFGMLALRVILGGIFIYSGYAKLGSAHAMTAEMFMKFGLGGSGMAYFVGLLELVGGVMVLLGVMAGFAAAWLSIIMVVAVVILNRAGGGLMGALTPLVVLGGTLAIFGNGAGAWRLVKMECHCPKCKMAMSEMGAGGGCCGGKEKMGGSCGGASEKMCGCGSGKEMKMCCGMKGGMGMKDEMMMKK